MTIEEAIQQFREKYDPTGHFIIDIVPDRNSFNVFCSEPRVAIKFPYKFNGYLVIPTIKF